MLWGGAADDFGSEMVDAEIVVLDGVWVCRIRSGRVINEPDCQQQDFNCGSKQFTILNNCYAK